MTEFISIQKSVDVSFSKYLLVLDNPKKKCLWKSHKLRFGLYPVLDLSISIDFLYEKYFPCSGSQASFGNSYPIQDYVLCPLFSFVSCFIHTHCKKKKNYKTDSIFSRVPCIFLIEMNFWMSLAASYSPTKTRFLHLRIFKRGIRLIYHLQRNLTRRSCTIKKCERPIYTTTLEIWKD